MKQPLTDRERMVAWRLASGLSRGEIAEELGITVDGVRAHVDRIYAKIGGKGKKRRAIASFFLHNKMEPPASSTR